MERCFKGTLPAGEPLLRVQDAEKGLEHSCYTNPAFTRSGVNGAWRMRTPVAS